jgi:predicted metal-binding membrane protein
MSRAGMPIDAGRWQSRLLIFGSLGAVAALSWLYLAHMNAGMTSAAPHSHGMAGMAMPAMAPRLATQFLTAGAMWSVMMVAMMLPTALPAAATFEALARRRAAHTQTVAASTALYVGGYIAAWTVYAALAAAGQIALSRAALLTPALESASLVFSALILLGAGAFQFSALKDACLSKCRTPLAFFLAEWRDGPTGALKLGFRHGGYCVGCCWAVMALMFVVGAMNLALMAALTLFILVEKIAPVRWRVREISGAVLVAWGLWLAVAGLRLL